MVGDEYLLLIDDGLAFVFDNGYEPEVYRLHDINWDEGITWVKVFGKARKTIYQYDIISWTNPHTFYVRFAGKC